MLTYQEAIALVRVHAKPLGTEKIPVQESMGRVLAEPILATQNLPPFDNSAVDGYGIHQQDLNIQGPLQLVATIAAGTDPTHITIQPGQCVRIFTGAPVPPSVSAVVMQEDVDLQDSQIYFKATQDQGTHIRKAGAEATTGSTLVPADSQINPAIVALASSTGLAELTAYRLPRVGILSTGSELALPGEPLQPGQIYEANTNALMAALIGLGIYQIETLRASDTLEETRQMLAKLLSSCDLVLTTGGVSVGDYDVVKQCLQELDVETIFWRVAIKPGKPIYFGHRPGGPYVFGLPGNPLSCLTTFQLFVKPFLLETQGVETLPEELECRLAEPLQRAPGREEFIPCKTLFRDGDHWAYPDLPNSSQILGGLAQADSFLVVPPELSELKGDQRVKVVKISWGRSLQ